MTGVNNWLPDIQRVAQSAGFPPALLAAVVDLESGGDPAAYRAEPHIDDASIGLCQLLMKTARTLGYSGAAGTPDALSGLFNPETNLMYGAKFLRDLWAKYSGDVARVASAYNGGDRPALGFGTRVTTNDVNVCLERDETTGDCTRYFHPQVGEFGNQPYVNTFLAKYSSWQLEFELAPPAPTSIDVTHQEQAATPDDADEAGADPGGLSPMGCAVVMVLGSAAAYGAITVVHSL